MYIILCTISIIKMKFLIIHLNLPPGADTLLTRVLSRPWLWVVMGGFTLHIVFKYFLKDFAYVIIIHHSLFSF